MHPIAGILTFIEDPLEQFLVWIHETTTLPWAWSIIVLTAIVRLVIFPITAKQTRTTLAMQRLQPHIKALQQKYKDDRQALSQATMDFYKDNRVNPFASCLPILVQIPVFMALFFVLKDFEAPAGTTDNFTFLFGFVDNIRVDISDAGVSGWILVLVYVASQMLSTVTMVTTPDPMQKWLFMLMPVVFVPFIVNFPIGVMLYWITTNLWSLGQYKLVIALTNTDVEVVLPADSKGNKKVIGSKASKSTARDQSDMPQPVARYNKRRRKR